MIHSPESEISSSGYKAPRSQRAVRGPRHPHADGDSEGISTSSWPVVGFGHRRETHSLWDTGLLDRLSVPLTRYHE
jgi:hypothetical protein